jgi:hypothetical protein
METACAKAVQKKRITVGDFVQLLAKPENTFRLFEPIDGERRASNAQFMRDSY